MPRSHPDPKYPTPYDDADLASDSEACQRVTPTESRSPDPAHAMESIQIHLLDHSLWPGVKEAYELGRRTGEATFDDSTPTYDSFVASHIDGMTLVATTSTGAVAGWVGAMPVSSRAVFAGVVEISLFVHPAYQGQGIGSLLVAQAQHRAEELGIWSIRAGIFPENHASIAVHRRAGFYPVGTYRRVGLMAFGPHAGRWRDVFMMEWRSQRVGTE
ncbi:GNAT family N-acetyltransferase [Devriesea agamarum]|uniref:GNAT family N-acetyltransferase n=1 Tax=Devriesea agamarum TaxID=472569 RepID=UPI000AC6B475|nr:GNAT family N-acetyltransferase [Devriesea agamarum]